MKKVLFLSAFLFAMSAGYAQTAAKAPEGGSKAGCAGAGHAKCCAHGAEKPSCAHASQASDHGDAKAESTAPAASATAGRKSGRAKAATPKSEN